MSSAAALHQALEWQVTFWSGEVTQQERDGFAQWLDAAPAHAQAWAQVQRTDAQLQSLARPAAAQALRARATPQRRRALLGIAGLLAGGGLAAYAGRETSPWQRMLADHSSARGERREIVLPDGTRIVLGSASAIDVHYGPRQRQVRLLAGEIFISTAADASARPFMVQTAQGTVRALGTRFGVRQTDDWIEVGVEQGAVEISPATGGMAARQRVDAGQQARFSQAGVQAIGPLAANATAWRRGVLVAERMRLEDFLAELGRYRSGVLRSDPAVRDLIVSGVYPLDDTDHALRILAQALPLQITTTTRWWVTVRPAG
ncbi:MAG: FecR domain-containing protein [Comamonas sp.]